MESFFMLYSPEKTDAQPDTCSSFTKQTISY